MCEKCRTTKDSNITFTENKSSITISNSNKRELTVNCVDGCKITEGIRCDWLLVDNETQREVFIELKGKDVSHAVDQLKASIDILSKGRRETKYGYVICTRSPLNSTDIQMLQKTVLRSHQMKLRVKAGRHQEVIESLLS